MSGKIIKGAEYLVVGVNKDDIFAPEEFSDEQKQMADTAKQYIQNSVLPDIEEIDKQNFELVVEHLKECGELGLFMIDVPEEYGGLELGKVTSTIISEKIGPSGSFSIAFSAHMGIGTLPLVYFGTAAQKERYLEKLATGECLAAYCLTEPNSGSDALSAKSTAVLSDDGKYYSLNGMKQFITNAGFADLFTIFAKIDGKHFTAFLVEKDFEGISIDKEESKLGIKGSSTCAVNMDNLKVPVENLLGQIGKGHKIAFNILNIGRFKLGALTVGAAKAALVESVKYANERKQFGVSIGSFGAIKEKLACMTADIFASESVIYRIAGHLDQQLNTLEKGTEDYYQEYEKSIEEYSVECAIAKVFCSEIFAKAADETVQIFGGYGYVKGYPAERIYRDERINRLFEGTNEINRLIITSNVLKKAIKGELPLQEATAKAFEALKVISTDRIAEEGPLAIEKQLINHLKQVFLILAGAAVQKFGDKLKNEQEILMSIADIAIQVFAIESVVLRVEKILASAPEKMKSLLFAVVKVFAFESSEKIATFAKQGAFYIEKGGKLQLIMNAIQIYTQYNASGLLKAKRRLADQVLESELYPFSMN
jgi:alkylation response protein AidB-like acyl-CoA dehydrogenase